MPTVAFSPLSELPEAVAAGPVGERFAQEMGCEGGAVTLAAAAAWLRALPYGSIDSELLAQDSLPVLAAKTGDCVDKHRAFLAFAHEAKQQFTWVKGFYKLTDKIVPGIADGLRAAGIGPPFLPATGDGGEAWVASFHCFVRMDGADAPPQFFDLTDGNCDGKAFRPTEYEVTIDSAPDMDPRCALPLPSVRWPGGETTPSVVIGADHPA